MSAAAPGAPATALGMLRLYVACPPFLMAVEAEAVERLLLLEEAELQPGADSPRPEASLGLVVVGRLSYSAWDLSQLVGCAPQPAAWVLLRLPRPGGLLPLALRTGACAAVRPLPPRLFSLPAGIARARRGLFDAAFPVSGLARAGASVSLGLCLRLQALLSEEEASFAEAELRHAVIA